MVNVVSPCPRCCDSVTRNKAPGRGEGGQIIDHEEVVRAWRGRRGRGIIETFNRRPRAPGTRNSRQGPADQSGTDTRRIRLTRLYSWKLAEMCMMDGIQTMLKFLLIFFNFIIFVSIASRQNFYSVKSHSHIFPGCRSCCIRNRRLGNCGRSKVYRTLRQGKSFNRIRWSSNERFRRRKSLAPRSTHQRWN